MYVSMCVCVCVYIRTYKCRMSDGDRKCVIRTLTCVGIHTRRRYWGNCADGTMAKDIEIGKETEIGRRGRPQRNLEVKQKERTFREK